MELVRTRSFDEFMADYYELNKNSNGTETNVTTTGDYEQDKESGIITRRDFLKYSALGTATLIMGASTEKAEAVIPLIIGLIALGSTVWASDQYIDWEIEIGNESYDETLKENGNFKLVGEKPFVDGKTYANGTFTVPPRKSRIYRNRSLRANVRRDTRAFIRAHFHKSNHRTKSDRFTIRA